MKWIEVKIEIHGLHGEDVTDLIAGEFHDLGTKGVVIDDPALAPADGWGKDAVLRPECQAVTGYLPLNDRSRDRLNQLHRRQKELSRQHGLDLRLTHREINDEDWAESWKAFFKPVCIGRDVVIKPTWENVTTDPGTVVIDIDPGMAFGTGTHATTVLCLRLIRKFLAEDTTFLDVGTGTGILSIAAAKFGARSVVAVDTDPDALAIAAVNFERNGIPPGRFRSVCGNLLQWVSGRFDLVVANILTEPILELLIDLHRVLEPNGIFVCSGIISQHRERVVRALIKNAFDILAVESLGEWIGFAVRPAQARIDRRTERSSTGRSRGYRVQQIEK